MDESNKLTWTVDGRSEVSTWGTYGLRVKRIGKGRWWWCVSGVLNPPGRQVRLVDGMVRCRKEAVNAAEAGLCSVSEEYRKVVEARREPDWWKKIEGWRPQVGGRRI